MISKFFNGIALLLISLTTLSSEFSFQNEYDPDTEEGYVRLWLANDTGDFIGFACDPSNTSNGPYMWINLKEQFKNSSSFEMFYQINRQAKVNFKTWKEGDYLVLTIDGKYGNKQFEWIENFLQSLQNFETLTLGRSKSIREAKFQSPQNKENLIKFFEQAITIDSCYARSVEQELEENKAKEEAEAERKRKEAEAEAERKRKEAEAEEERKRKEAEAKEKQAKRYADFKADISKIIKQNYLFNFIKPEQQTRYYDGPYEDTICWETQLYEYILEKNGTEFEHLEVIDHQDYFTESNTRTFSSSYFSSGLWNLAMIAEMPTNNKKLEVKLSEISAYSENAKHCLDFNSLRRNYSFEDLNSSEYKNMASIIGEEPTYKRLNLRDTATLISRLNFTLFIGGFAVDSEFERLSEGFYEKWGKSEFIEIRQGYNIRDRKIFFLNKDGKPTPIKISWSFDPYSYEIEGSFSVEEQDFDWTVW